MAARTQCLFLVLLLGACAPPPASIAPPARTPMKVPPLPLDVLGGVFLGTDAESRDAAEKLTALGPAFEQAARAYEAGDYRSAAVRFLAAAREARGAAGSYTRQALANHRASCYRNAAKAFYMAGAFEQGRPQIEEAARQDPPCEGEIRRILELLGREQ